jgi:RAB protein geranylgeranyltransferase component A
MILFDTSRVCAVFGGTYILNYEIDRVMQDDQAENNSRFVVQGKDGTKVQANHLILSKEYSHFVDSFKKRTATKVSRAIAIIDGMIKISQKQSVVVIPPNTFNNKEAIAVLQHTNETHACPRGKSKSCFFMVCMHNY